MLQRRTCALLVVLALCGTRGSRAQCSGWERGFGLPGFAGSLQTLGVHDDGTGPAFYAGGGFSFAGGEPAQSIARWNGTSWEALGAGLEGSVGWPARALATFDEGAGPRLFVGGTFDTAGGAPANRIARWDGTQWSTLGSGTNGFVRALEVHDDGTGPALYVAGDFTQAGGLTVDAIARWDGVSWSAVGAPPAFFRISDLAVFDDGNGPALFAAAWLFGSGGHGVYRWDGAGWSLVGPAFDNLVDALEVFDDGTGPDLFAGGTFTNVGPHIARWDGVAWSSVAGGTDLKVTALGVHDEGSGPALYAGGSFTFAGAVPAQGVARWDGASWSALGAGVRATGGPPVLAFGSLPTPGGSALVAGGNLDFAGALVVSSVAAWSQGQWSPLPKGNGFLAPSGVNLTVSALTTVDGSSGPVLYAGGNFEAAGTTPALRVARLDGACWSALGSGIGTPASGSIVHALAGHDDGNGPVLYAGGNVGLAGGTPASHVARWDGASWSPLGAGVDDAVRALALFDSGSGVELFAAGKFATAGGASSPNVARWDGTQWSGPGIPGNEGLVFAVHDDGTGPALYVAGAFSQAQVHRWTGAGWAALPVVPFGLVESLASFDDGSGPALYVGATAVPNQHSLFRFRGGVWATVTSGINDQIRTLHVFDDGAGPALFAGGDFTFLGGVLADHVARYDGSGWSAVDGGTNARVFSLGSRVAGGRRTLFAGGYFDLAGAELSRGIAAWSDPCANRPSSYCSGKPNSAGCVPFVSYTGTPSASSPAAFRIAANDVVPSEAGLLIYAQRKANLDFHGGKLCVKVPFVRTRSKAPVQTGGACSGWTLHRDFNAVVQAGSDPSLTVGATVFAQWRQRDPGDPAGFGDGLTDALRFTVGP